MKKKTILITAAICILLIVSAVYFNEYPIKRDMDVMAVQKIVNAEFASKGDKLIGIGLEDKEYIYLTSRDDELVVVHLQKGLFGRMKFSGMSYSDSTFCNGIVEANGVKYIVVGGRNEAHQIARVEFSLNSRTYEIELEDPYELFLKYIEIDKNIEDEHIAPESMKLYNSNGEDITALYNLSSFGI